MDQWDRRLRDLCADCYNSWHRWQELNNESILIAQSLANDRILLFDPKPSAASDPDFDEDAVKARLNDTFAKKVIPMLAKFEQITLKFRKLVSDIDSLKKLRDFKSGDFDKSVEFDRLCKLVMILRDTFEKELECKRAAFNDLPMAKSRNATVISVACFVHQPYVDETELTMLLEACVLDCGHKNA